MYRLIGIEELRRTLLFSPEYLKLPFELFIGRHIIKYAIYLLDGNRKRCGAKRQKPMKSIILGTAGHIDHGKTALVKALTGIDADRLEEEKRRGITIDLGFAHLELTAPSGEKIRLGFIDVPGHERFVRNMLA